LYEFLKSGIASGTREAILQVYGTLERPHLEPCIPYGPSRRLWTLEENPGNSIRRPEIQVHEEILMDCSLFRVERKRSEEDAKAVYTKVDH